MSSLLLFTMLPCIASGFFVFNHITSHHITSHHISTSLHTTHHIRSRHIISYHITSHCISTPLHMSHIVQLNYLPQNNLQNFKLITLITLNALHNHFFVSLCRGDSSAKGRRVWAGGIEPTDTTFSNVKGTSDGTGQ